MTNIITIPNDNDPVFNGLRRTLYRWARRNSWGFTGYNDQFDHITQIRRVARGPTIRLLDFVCHGAPEKFDHTASYDAVQFGTDLSQVAGFNSTSEVYLDACNTALTSIFVNEPIAQKLADGTRCTVYGTTGYMTGTYAQGNEQCFAGPDVPSGPLPPYPGAQSAVGRDVWIAFRPRLRHATVAPQLAGLTVGVDIQGRVWVGVDPNAFRDFKMTSGNSINIYSMEPNSKDLAKYIERILRSRPVPFPALRMAPDATINYYRKDDVLILDVYANGGLIKDRISGKTWRVKNSSEFSSLVCKKLA